MPTGQFAWMSKIGATDQAIAVLNDQPSLFTTLLVVLVGLLVQVLMLFYIHWATMKPDQAKKKRKWLSFLPMKNLDNARRRIGNN
ncbi:hypothetical protein PT974_00377 [Cladobotryum mycophilum]|uniref:Uncharacterized protein n=1 Tax=Cladobotryum mycophilum TaxID=491253 RepID=A0ABR0T0M4_9HYPO